MPPCKAHIYITVCVKFLSQGRHEKKYLLYEIGFVAVVLLAIFWYSVENFTPVYFTIAFVIGVILLYLTYRRVDDFVEDERSARITEKAAMPDAPGFLGLFLRFFDPGCHGHARHTPSFPCILAGAQCQIPVPTEVMPLRMIGYIQSALLCLMIFLYVGFRIYYARKYGDWETDEK